MLMDLAGITGLLRKNVPHCRTLSTIHGNSRLLKLDATDRGVILKRLQANLIVITFFDLI
jgi:hypothetical protein